MGKKMVVYYSFNVEPEKEERFNEYMEKYATPLMTKYYSNWEFFKIHLAFGGKGQPQYIGRFDIESREVFFKEAMPEEMKV
ncbi:MAG: hypothetical protein GY756_20355, partial [bacterium]|nr:hypothetical protein [bacterium]